MYCDKIGLKWVKQPIYVYLMRVDFALKWTDLRFLSFPLELVAILNNFN